MAEYLARDVRFSASTTMSGTYTEVRGVNTFTLARAMNATDVTVFDDAGDSRSTKTSRKVTLTMAGVRTYGDDGVTRDPGQVILDAAANQLGNAGRVYVMVEPRNEGLDEEDDGYIEGLLHFQATVMPATDVGGANDAVLPWGVALEMYGAPIAKTGFFENDL